MSSRIAISLYDEHVTSFDLSELLAGNPLKPVAFLDASISSNDALLFLKQTSTSTPDWVEIIQSFGNLNSADATTASSGAILFLKIGTRVLACCFGSTVANINRNNIIGDFGLAVAYQKIRKRDIKIIESYMLSANPITNSRSSAVPTSQDNFNIDNYLENITELGGKFFSKVKSVMVKGKEFFSIPAPLNFKETKELCESAIRDYHISINDETFKRLTATKKIKEKTLINYLNDDLCKQLNKRSLEISLVDFEVLSEISSYTLSPKGQKHEDLTIESFYNDLPRGHVITLSYLRDKRVTTFGNASQEITAWPVYKCLFGEFKINVGIFLLYKGNWYEIQDRFIKDLKAFIKDYEVDRRNYSLPKWDRNQREDEFNNHAARVIGGQCWDKELYTHPEYSYGIEFCDMLAKDSIIHVKKEASSALNSHLLLQTCVSAYLMRFDRGIREWIKSKSKSKKGGSLILNRKNEFKNPEIVYVIALLSNSDKAPSESLPFFSLVSFNLVIKKIVQLGFGVKICKC